VITIERTTELELCLEIRRIVFMVEQKVSLAEEVDGLDSECDHFIARKNGVPAGTARLRMAGDLAKGERLCVLRSARGHRIATALLEALEARARERGARTLLGAAQVQALPLYESLGFLASGNEFLDAGIVHKTITKPL